LATLVEAEELWAIENGELKRGNARRRNKQIIEPSAGGFLCVDVE